MRYSIIQTFALIATLGASLLSFHAMGTNLFAQQTQQKEWLVPTAGNVYRSKPDPFNQSGRQAGALSWNDLQEVYSIYFHVDRACELILALEARSESGTAQLRARVGHQRLSTTINGKEFTAHDLGEIKIKEAGHVRVDLQGKKLAGQTFGEIKGMIVRSQTEGLKVTCVANNEGNLFYWGRRGPSVHLAYVVPGDVDLEYAYSEITVDKGNDPIGSYFMANGFREGYFGFQVNSERERRVLFSVWSPFQTDNPRNIPQDQQVEMLARGSEVTTGEFGNEGSGGQSYLNYPWKPGRTYRFLTQVTPDNQGNTIYTSWFGDKKSDEWRLIASFRRPKTNTHLRGFHSFLENFHPQTGHISRTGQHQNIWVRDTKGNWHECLSAKFSVDATGGGGHRLDFTGGADQDKFFLRNCGFFNETGVAGETFNRTSSSGNPPRVNLDELPRK